MYSLIKLRLSLIDWTDHLSLGIGVFAALGILVGHLFFSATGVTGQVPSTPTASLPVHPVIDLGMGTDSRYEKFPVVPGTIPPEAVLGNDQIASVDTINRKTPMVGIKDNSNLEICLEISSDRVFAGEWVTVKATVGPGVHQTDITVTIDFTSLNFQQAT